MKNFSFCKSRPMLKIKQMVSKVLFITIVFVFFPIFFLKAQEKITTLVSVKKKATLAITAKNNSDSSIYLPNSIREEIHSDTNFSQNSDTLFLKIFHKNWDEDDSSILKHGALIQKGVAAYELINAGDTKYYFINVPRKYRMPIKLDQINHLKLDLFDENKYYLYSIFSEIKS